MKIKVEYHIRNTQSKMISDIGCVEITEEDILKIAESKAEKLHSHLVNKDFKIISVENKI